MNSMLSGTAWGELPEAELEIPYFMTAEYRDAERRIADEYEANVAAAVSRERRKLRAERHKETKERKNFRIGLSLVPVAALALMLAAYVVEAIL